MVRVSVEPAARKRNWQSRTASPATVTRTGKSVPSRQTGGASIIAAGSWSTGAGTMKAGASVGRGGIAAPVFTSRYSPEATVNTP